MENERIDVNWEFRKKEPRIQVWACRVCQLIWELKTNGGIGMQVIISLHPPPLSLPAYSTPRLFSRSPSVPPIPSVSRGTVWPVSVKPEGTYLSRTHGGACGPLVPSSPRLGLEWRTGELHLPKAAAGAQENESSSANDERPPIDGPKVDQRLRQRDTVEGHGE